jgi:hypothetical protein
MNSRSIKSRVLVVAVAALAASATAVAGYRQTTRTVVVDTAARTAKGQLAGARASTDTTQFITCTVTVSDSLPDQEGGTFSVGNCLARDARGVVGFCATWDSAMLATIATLQGDSNVSFSWATNGSCTAIETSQGSHLEPKR